MIQLSDSRAKVCENTSLTQQIQQLVARLNPQVTLDRRHDERVPLPVLFRLTPIDGDRQPVPDQSITVVGKNISRRGLSFFHERPLPYRRAVICLAHPELGHFAAEIDINWCRFTKPGWYESGGRLVRTVNPSDDDGIDGADTAACQASTWGKSFRVSDDTRERS